SSGSLDLLTEAQVLERFPRLRTDLQALYAAYYVAELLADWTEDYDPHPSLFDEARETLQTVGTPGTVTALRLARFELVLLRELGYAPALRDCVACGAELTGDGLAFSPAAGGVLCPRCAPRQRVRRPLSAPTWHALRELNETGGAWRRGRGPAGRQGLRQRLGPDRAYLLGGPAAPLAYL